MNERDSEKAFRVLDRGRARLVLLVGTLISLLIGGYFVYFAPNPPDPTAGKTSGLQEDAFPTRENVLGFLNGKTIPPWDVKDALAEEAKPLVLKREQIEALEIKREDDWFTSVRLLVKTDQGRYSVAGTINHGFLDSDRSRVMYTFRGAIVSRE